MPDNCGPGELEDFVQTMIRPDDPIWPRAERYIEGIPAEDRRFTDGKATGAKVHAWLAAQERPRPMGLAIQAGDLDVSAVRTSIPRVANKVLLSRTIDLGCGG